jgi:hypothetical protein
MVTVMSYGFLAFTGHRVRSHKNHAGTVHHDELDGFTKAAFCAAIAVIASLMFLRMRTEVLYAVGAQARITALVIAVALAPMIHAGGGLARDGVRHDALAIGGDVQALRPPGKVHF